jgi:hypothetical protein
MESNPHSTQEKIHINCPYCWTEFTDFEQIGKGIDFKHFLYRDVLIFPIEKSDTFPNFLRFHHLGRQQRIEKIWCPGCECEYTIVLLPFGLYPITYDREKLLKPEISHFSRVPKFLIVSEDRLR